MTSNSILFSEWQKRFKAGEFEVVNKANNFAGWADWLCRETLLASKTQTYGNFLMKLKKSKKLDPTSAVVVLKNLSTTGLMAISYDTIQLGVSYGIVVGDTRLQIQKEPRTGKKVLLPGTFNKKGEPENESPKYAILNVATGLYEFWTDNAKDIVEWFND